MGITPFAELRRSNVAHLLLNTRTNRKNQPVSNETTDAMPDGGSINEEESLYSTSQKIVLAIVPAFTGTLSVAGSSTIIFIILNDRKRKLQLVYHRLVLAMSVVDVVYSTSLALSVLMVPKGDVHGWGSQGNLVTCEVQGFCGAFFGIAAFLYNTCLAVYYLLVIRYGVRESFLGKYHVEKLMHLLCISYPLCFAVLNLMDDMLNQMKSLAGWCFVQDNPSGCSDDPTVDCIRGDKDSRSFPRMGRWGAMVPLVLALSIMTVCMVLIYSYVRQQERTIWSKYGRNMRPLHEAAMKRTRDTAKQAVLYVGGLFLTVAPTVPLYASKTVSSTTLFVFALLVKIFLPLQGLWNCVIYLRPRYNAIRSKLENESFGTILYAVVVGDSRKEARRNVDLRRSSATSKQLYMLSKRGGGSDWQSQRFENGDSQRCEKSIKDSDNPRGQPSFGHLALELATLHKAVPDIDQPSSQKKCPTFQTSSLDEVVEEENVASFHAQQDTVTSEESQPGQRLAQSAPPLGG